MGITSSGPYCDICGDPILPLPDEMINWFKVDGFKEKLCCDNKCKVLVNDIMGGCGSWRDLPSGPLRDAFEKYNAPAFEALARMLRIWT